MTDLEIAQAQSPLPIIDVAQQLGLKSDQLELYGNFKAKLTDSALRSQLTSTPPHGKLVLVTAMSPTPAGEGKTTVSIGLADGLRRLGQSVALALREPSLGPVLGLKGGACGGGYAQIIPMEDINLHFTGDLHAITAAHNLLAALVDNHLYHGNQLKIDRHKIVWRRALDMNDRALRQITVGLDSHAASTATPLSHQSGFDITAASELMAILCLASDLADLKQRISQIVVAYTEANQPITAADLQAEGAMTTLLKQAFRPNLVQTLEGTPVLIHGGPFANIAHGCNSLIATRTALNLADIVVTEAGFGAELGAEKFFDLKCSIGNLQPAAVILVATVQALKLHGGVTFADRQLPNLAAIKQGFTNLQRHLINLRQFGLRPIVAINRFTGDTDDELQLIKQLVQSEAAPVAMINSFQQGGKGAEELAHQLLAQLTHSDTHFQPLYQSEQSLLSKIETIAKRLYGAKSVTLTPAATGQLQLLKTTGYDQLPICIAKTQYSLSDDPKLLGAPNDFEFTVRELRLAAGAGFIVVLAGQIMTMPGLPAQPAACQINIDDQGQIQGLF